MSDPVLEACGVGHAFGATVVLDAVDLELRPGELLLVLGPNGAGKTTLLRILSGLLRPRAGRVKLHGRGIGAWGRRELAREIAVVPQELAVPFAYSVRELVAMGRAPHLGALGREGVRDRAAVDGALASLGLLPFSGRAYPTLSGGEKQRVTLARALAQGSDILLLDEPTAHMDLGHRLHTFEWLRGWLAGDARRAALVVTHDLILASRFADRVALLAAGRVVASGEVAGVLTPERIGRVYDVDAQVSRDADGRPVVVARRSRIRYTPRPDEPDRQRPRP